METEGYSKVVRCDPYMLLGVALLDMMLAFAGNKA